MSKVPGTQGYEREIARFVEGSQRLSFAEVCAEILPFLPASPSRVLDIGAGAGQNSAALADLGHSVVAVEPMITFLDAARDAYGNKEVQWINDALPDLEQLENTAQFNFVLVEAMWHHLSTHERKTALKRLSSLLLPDGRLACSLRNGPPGLGLHVFPTDPDETIQHARDAGLECIFRKENLPSHLPNKSTVTWSRLVFVRSF